MYMQYEYMCILREYICVYDVYPAHVKYTDTYTQYMSNIQTLIPSTCQIYRYLYLARVKYTHLCIQVKYTHVHTSDVIHVWHTCRVKYLRRDIHVTSHSSTRQIHTSVYTSPIYTCTYLRCDTRVTYLPCDIPQMAYTHDIASLVCHILNEIYMTLWGAFD